MPQTTLLDLEAFRAQARQGKAPDAATLFKLATTEPQVVGGASSRIRRFVFSDESVDHEGDVIKQSGWDLSVFARNSVALWAHCSWELPIGKAHNVAVRGGKLIGDIEFAEESLYPFANTVFELVKGGFLKAVSVGFIPKDWKFSSDKARPNGLDFIKQLLCEISVVPVPANPAALIEARASGIDVQPLRVWAEQVLSGERGSSLARRDVEATYRHAAEPRRGRVTRSAETDQLNECLDDLNASIAGNRETLKTMKALLPSDPYHPYPPPPPGADDYPPAPGPAPDPASTVDPPIDFGPLQTACGHVSEAIARKTKAVGALRDALAGASPGPDSEDPIDTPQARLAEARRLRAQVERSAADWRCGASRDLPLDDSDSWDGPAAEASIWAHAGGDDFDPSIARKAFLAYDASAPKLRGSYKLPFCHVDDGTLKACRGGIRAAAARLPQADISESARTEAQAVIDHYEKAFMPKAATPAERVAEARRLRDGLERAAERRQEVAELLAEAREEARR